MWRFWRQCGKFQAVCVSLQSVGAAATIAAGCLAKQTGDHDTLASVCAGRADRLPWAAMDFETQSSAAAADRRSALVHPQLPTVVNSPPCAAPLFSNWHRFRHRGPLSCVLSKELHASNVSGAAQPPQNENPHGLFSLDSILNNRKIN